MTTTDRPVSSASPATHKLWGGRFAGGPSPLLDAINRSIGTDFRLWPHDVRLSQAWALALGQAGVLTHDESEALQQGLGRVAQRIADGAQPVATDEDIHTMIDRLLHEEAGSVASKLHTGRSRNDQVATASRLWTIDACHRLDAAIRELQEVLVMQAETLTSAILPAYTHLQRAQPVSGAHWLLAHFWPLDRDRTRLANAERGTAVLPLGSGAIAGSAFPVSRVLLKESLGFAAISPNSIDATGDRDFVAETLFVCALTAAHCSRLAEDLILYGTSEFGFVKFGDGFSTGSSMMPQKRNPDSLELIRGKAGRVFGGYMGLLVTMKGLPMTYNRDMQEDKEPLFEVVNQLLQSLEMAAVVVQTAVLKPEVTRKAVEDSWAVATDLADALARAGMPFHQAHKVVGRLVLESVRAGKNAKDWTAGELTAFSEHFTPEMAALLDPAEGIKTRGLKGGTGPDAVAAAFAEAQQRLAAMRG